VRPITVSIGPSLSSTTNNICTSQQPAGTSGRATCTFTGGNASIAATNGFIAGQAVKFSTIGTSGASPSNDAGTLPTGFVTNLVYYVIASGLSSTHFEVSQTPAGGAVVPGSNTLTGTQFVNYTNTMAINGTLASNGVASLTTPQRVLITTADSTTKFTLYGTSASGTPQSETLTSNGANVQSALDYLTITSITVNQQPTATVTVGTNGVGSTPYVRLDEWANNNVSIQCDVTGTVNYTVQVSNDDPNAPWGTPVAPSAMTWINTNDTNAVGATAGLQTNFLFAPLYARVLLNSGSGSVTAVFSQSSVVPY
jgi:hypothetical protein